MTVAVAEPAGLVRRVFRDVMRAIRKAQNTDGVMVALFMPPDVAAELAQPGGVPAEQLHLTLRILAGDASQVEQEDIDEWAAAVEQIAKRLPVVSGNVSGVGRFNGDQAGGGQDVIYATVDAPALADLFDQVRWACQLDDDDDDGEDDDEPEHGFTPHVTLGYGNTLETPEVPTIPVRFDRLTLAIGDERREYLFAGADTADADDGPTTAKPAPPIAMPVMPGVPATPGALPATMIAKSTRKSRLTKAEWSTAFVNALPDSAFAVIKPGGTKDDEGKTIPRSNRMLPYKDDAGKVDLPHLRNSLSRVAQANTDLTDAQRASAKAKLSAAASGALAKALEDVGESVAKAMGESGFLGELEVEAIGLDDRGVVIRAGGPTGVLFVAKDDGSGAYTTGDLASGGTKAPQQGLPRRRRPNSPGATTPPPTMSGTVSMKVAKSIELDRFAVVKAISEQRYSLGVAYPAKLTLKADNLDTDAHGESMSPDELEAAAWRFMADGAKDSGLMHKDGTDGAGKVVESYIYRGPTWKVDDQTVEAGDWLLGVLWDAPSWDAIKRGDLTGYSLQGLAARESV